MDELQANWEALWHTSINFLLAGFLIVCAALTDSRLGYWIWFGFGFTLLWLGWRLQVHGSPHYGFRIDGPRHYWKLILAIVPLLASGGAIRWAFHSPTKTTGLLTGLFSAICFVVGFVILLSRQGDVFKAL